SYRSPPLKAASGVDAWNVHRSFNDSGTIGDGWSISGSGPWLLAVMLSLIILVTACGNILLIALVFAHRSLRCTSNCFLVSLFLSDLMVALVVMPPAMLNVLCGTWVLAPGFCPVWLCFDVMCCSASILNLCVISLDRYLFIISPLRYKQHMTPPRALLLVGGAWGLAALTSFLPIKMDWHSLGRTPSMQCRLRVTLPFALVATFLTFFLPSTAICFTYCRILLAARRQARQVEALTHPPYPHHSPGEPSHPPSTSHAIQDGDDYSHQEPPVLRQALVSPQNKVKKHPHSR
uniref:G-protein coupled receptors family 1 profile domain-containing protein n=1 Tax=Sinocyclocheilus rhinocerous TaxID=307959 RepID=A0A673JEW0_9TELE